MAYQTIKQLVIEQYSQCGGMPPYDELTLLVRQHFPNSRWKETHYAWYKSQIKTGRITVTDDPTPEEPEDIDAEVERAIEMRASMEHDVRDYLARNLEKLEPRLSLHGSGIEHSTDVGRIDILAVDGSKRHVVVELKAGRASDSALGQLLGYMGCLSEKKKNVRGILVAFDFEDRVVRAARALPNIRLVKYALDFRFENVA